MVLLRRLRRDDRVVDRLLAHGHALDVQHRERLDRGVEAGVVAERALGRPLPRLQVALEDDLRLRRDLQRHGQAVDHLDPLAAQEAGEQVFVDVAGQRGAGRVADHRVAADRDGHRQPLAAALGDRVVRGASPCGSASACRACSSSAAAAGRGRGCACRSRGAWCGSARSCGRCRRRRARPAGRAAGPRSTSSPLSTTSWQGAVLTFFGGSDLSCSTLPMPSRMPDQPTGSSGLISAPIRSPTSSSESTPSAIAIRFSVPKRLTHDRHVTAGGPLEEQGRAAGPDRPGDDLADLQRRIDRHAHPAQLTGRLQRGDEALQIVVRKALRSHAPSLAPPQPR